MTENRNRKHLVDQSGVAVCGMPAKLEQLVNWGDADCDHCIALYSRRARQLRQ
jgi:hypothetical protein